MSESLNSYIELFGVHANNQELHNLLAEQLKPLCNAPKGRLYFIVMLIIYTFFYIL